MRPSMADFVPFYRGPTKGQFPFSYQTLCLIFGRQWHWINFLYGHFYCLQLWKNRLVTNFQVRDSKSYFTTRCWHYHPFRGRVREMLLRTTTILLGVRKGKFATWLAGWRSLYCPIIIAVCGITLTVKAVCNFCNVWCIVSNAHVPQTTLHCILLEWESHEKKLPSSNLIYTYLIFQTLWILVATLL